MPIALVIPVATAAGKAVGFALGPIIHQVFKNFEHVRNVATAKPLSFINDEQSVPRLFRGDSLEAPLSNAMVVYGSRSIIPSSSPRILVNLDNRSLVNIYSQVEAQVGKFASGMLGFGFRQLMDVSPISVDLKSLVDGYLGRITGMMQSAFQSFIADWRGTISALLVESVSESVVQKEAVISISILLQGRLSSFISKAVLILKEATHLLVKCEQQNVFKFIRQLVRQPFLIESLIKESRSDMLEVNYAVGSTIAAGAGKPRQSNTMEFFENVKRILSMVFRRSLDGHLDPLCRGSVEEEAIISFSTLSQALSVFQVLLSSLISKAIFTLKEATHLLPVVVAAIKVGGFTLGSIIHDEVPKHFGHVRDVATVNALSFINNEQSPRLVEGGHWKAAPTSRNAMVVYGSRSIIPSSSPRILVNLGNRSLVNIHAQAEDQVGKLASRIFGLAFRRQHMAVSLISVDLMQFVEWYLGRIVDLIQFAYRSLKADLMEMISVFLVESVLGSIVEEAAIMSFSTLLQVRLSSHLPVKCEQENVLRNIVRQQIPIESSFKSSHSETVEVNHSVASIIAADVSKRRLSIIVFLANVKRILSMVFERGLDGYLDPLRRASVMVSALICAMLLVSVSLIGWNIPFTLVGGGYDDSRLAYVMKPLEITGLPSTIATPRLTSIQSHSITFDAVFQTPRNLGNVPSLQMHSLEGRADANFNVDCHSLSLPSWSDGALWNDSVTESGTEGEPQSQIMWTTEPSAFETSPASFAFPRERDGDEVIPCSMTTAQRVPAENESFDPNAIVVNRVGLMLWSNDELSSDSHITSHIEVQNHAKLEAFVQVGTSDPSYLTRYEVNYLFVFTVTRGCNEITSPAVPTGQLALNEVEVYDQAAVVNSQHPWNDDEILADYPLQPSVEVMDASQTFWNAQSSHWIPIGHGCEMNLLILMVDLDGGASPSHRFVTEHSALAHAKEVVINSAAISIGGDGFLFIGIIRADSLSLVKVLVASLLERTSNSGRSSNRLVITAPQHEIRYPFRGSLSISEPSRNPSMTLISVFDQLMPQMSFIPPIKAVSKAKDLARLGTSLSTPSESNKLVYSFEVIKAGISSRNFEFRYLAWMLLLLLWNNCDDFEDLSEAEMVSNSETLADKFATPLDFATESDSIFNEECIGFDERRQIEKRKRLRTASKALHSDLGRHWKSPSKRRRRRSSRIRSKPKYFEPM